MFTSLSSPGYPIQTTPLVSQDHTLELGIVVKFGFACFLPRRMATCKGRISGSLSLGGSMRGVQVKRPDDVMFTAHYHVNIFPAALSVESIEITDE